MSTAVSVLGGWGEPNRVSVPTPWEGAVLCVVLDARRTVRQRAYLIPCAVKHRDRCCVRGQARVRKTGSLQAAVDFSGADSVSLCNLCVNVRSEKARKDAVNCHSV